MIGPVGGLHVAAAMALFGALLFDALVAEAPANRRLTRIAAAATLLLAMLRLALQARAVAPDDPLGALYPLLARTQFGWAWCLHVAAIVAAALVPARAGVLLSGVALAVLAFWGHGSALEDETRTIALAAQALHLIAAGAWLGGLVPLVLALRRADGIEAARRFSPIGMVAVALLAASAIVNAWLLIGGLASWIGTEYGRLALLKTALFAAMLGLAAVNRFRFVPRGTRRWLRASVALEAMLGLAVALVAGALAATPPSAHTQPWWPLPFRLDSAAFEVPELAEELTVSASVLGAGLMLLVVALVLRKLRLAAAGVAVASLLWAAPSAKLILVDAYPTSFQASPTGFSAASIAAGARLFATHCAACHGPDGKGGGDDKALTDLTAEHVFDHPDGDLFWWISTGKPGSVMPGFAAATTESERWALVDFVHANAYGARGWDRPVPAPDLACETSDGAYPTLSSLRGDPVHLLFEPKPERAAEPGPAPAIVWSAHEIAKSPACAAAGDEIVRAYAIIAGLDPGAMKGTEYLVDSAGYLRARWRDGETPDWRRPEVLARQIAAIERAPLAARAAAPHVH
jgi:putative copper export protein/mono/diheme cytochrome c family protein